MVNNFLNSRKAARWVTYNVKQYKIKSKTQKRKRKTEQNTKKQNKKNKLNKSGTPPKKVISLSTAILYSLLETMFSVNARFLCFVHNCSDQIDHTN